MNHAIDEANHLFKKNTPHLMLYNYYLYSVRKQIK